MQATLSAVKVAADILNWVMWRIDRLPFLGLESDDFPEKWQKQIFAWLAGLGEDGVKFASATEMMDRASADGIDKTVNELFKHIEETNLAFWRDIHDDLAMLSKVRVLRRFRARDRVRDLHRELADQAKNPEGYGEKAREAADELDKLLATLTEGDDLGGGVPPSELVHAMLSERDDGSLVKTGYPKLDKHLGGGIPPGDVLTVNGCTSVGKTVLFLNIMRKGFEVRPDDLTIFFSCEMPTAQIMTRHLMEWTQTSTEELGRSLEDSVLHPWPVPDRTPKAFDALARNYKVFETIYTVPGMRRAIAQFGRSPALVVIDYLQLLESPSRGGDEGNVQKIEANMYAIKRMAKEVGAAVLVLSQVPRAEHSDPSRELHLRSGKGSGAIEDASDFVMGIWRPYWSSEVQDGVDRSTMKGGIFKNRHGYLGEVTFVLELEHQRVREL